MLKPGGTLGVAEHRLDERDDSAKEEKSGYLKESTVIALAEAAGFKLAGRSEINANPKDTKDYEKGVWTLPPSLTEGETDRAKYVAIGESDRMTLKFVKPANRSEEHTSELQSLMRTSYAVFCLKKKKNTKNKLHH